MADEPVSEIIRAHPIGSGLDAFRRTVPPLLGQQLAWGEEYNAGNRSQTTSLSTANWLQRLGMLRSI
jgi:hypothetical protein